MLVHFVAIMVMGFLDPILAPAAGIIVGMCLGHGCNAEGGTERQCAKRGPELGVIHSLSPPVVKFRRFDWRRDERVALREGLANL
jgi:hypothetical protein